MRIARLRAHREEDGSAGRRAEADGPKHSERDPLEYFRLEDSIAIPLRGGAPQPFDPLDLLAPVTPSKIVGVARNYAAHAKELGHDLPAEPLFFLKPPSSVIGPGETIRLPRWSSEVHHEAELGVVIGRRLRCVAPSEVREQLLGFTCVNDVTARDVQRAQSHFTKAKGADGFCPIGPWIETDLLGAVQVRCRVNGELRQDGTSADMIFGIEELISYLSHAMTLEPGDVVATGTPAGVGPLRAGQIVEVEIPGIGILRNPVEAA